MRNELPEFYFFVLPDTGELVTIKSNEHGYYHSDWSTNDKVRNQEIADFQNRKLGITPAQRQAMECGSMFGWKSLGANPQLYMDKAEYVSSDRVKGHIKHPSMSVLYPVDGLLYCYEIAGEKTHYLELPSFSKGFMGADSDITLLPDLVRGKPLLPVHAEQSENGIYTFMPENGSFSFEQEINSSYRIIARVQVGPTEFVMGEHPKAPAQFVTWERTPDNEGDRGKNYYWGHYCTTREAATGDLEERAMQEYDIQRKRRNPHQKESKKER